MLLKELLIVWGLIMLEYLFVQLAYSRFRFIVIWIGDYCFIEYISDSANNALYPGIF